MLCYRSGRGDGAGDSLRQLVLQHPSRLHPVLLLREHGQGGALDSLRQRVEHVPLCSLVDVRQQDTAFLLHRRQVVGVIITGKQPLDDVSSM